MDKSLLGTQPEASVGGLHLRVVAILPGNRDAFAAVQLAQLFKFLHRFVQQDVGVVGAAASERRSVRRRRLRRNEQDPH